MAGIVICATRFAMGHFRTNSKKTRRKSAIEEWCSVFGLHFCKRVEVSHEGSMFSVKDGK